MTSFRSGPSPEMLDVHYVTVFKLPSLGCADLRMLYTCKLGQSELSFRMSSAFSQGDLQLLPGIHYMAFSLISQYFLKAVANPHRAYIYSHC